MKRTLALLLSLTIPMAGQVQAEDRDWWGSSEVLLWWTKDGSAPPPLATIAPAGSTAVNAGALNDPSASILLGGSDIDHGLNVGGRFTLGRWLGAEKLVGLEGNYLFLGEQHDSSSVFDDGGRFLANPFVDVAPGTSIPAANYLSVPQPLNNGSATLSTTHKLQGAELNSLFLLLEDERQTWSLLAGYRYLNVSEGLTFGTTQNDDFAFFPGQFVNTIDDFQTRNHFHGGQLGVRGRWERGRWFIDSTVKVALGNMNEIVRVRGSSTTNTGAGFAAAIPVTTVPGGIYAQPTNIGNFERDEFAVIPEASIRVGMEVVRNVRLFVAYNFLYVSQVARPGDQIDGSINSTQLVSFSGVPGGPLVGEPRPAPRVDSTDYWAQGVNFGLEFSW